MSQGNPEEAGKIYEELCRMEQLTAAERGVALFGLGTCLFLHESYAAASLQLRESWELLIASLGIKRLRRLFSFHPEPISSGGWPKPRS